MKKIKLSDSVKNITKISSGTVLGQLISIITLPFITRLYGAEIIGIWATINSISMILSFFSDLGLTNSLMMCDNDKLNVQYSLISKLTIVISAISSSIIFIFYLLSADNLKYSITIALFSAVYSLILVNNNICTTLLNRDKQYNVLMKNSVIRFGGSAILSIFLGIVGFKSMGYFIGNTVGQLFAFINMKIHLPKLQKHNCITEYIQLIKQNKDYVRYQMPAGITVNLRTELPNLLIGNLFGNTILGYYSISQKLLTIPVTFLGQSIGKVFYQKIAEMKRQGLKIGAFVDKNIKRGMIIALIPMTVLAAFGDVATILFFGNEYRIGGVICRIIVFRSLFNFISTATQGIDVVLNKQKYIFYTCASQTILAVFSVVCGYYLFNSIYATTILLVVTFIFVQITYFFKLYQVMQLNPFKYLIYIFMIIIVMVVVSLILRYGVYELLKLIDLPLIQKLVTCFVI